MKKISCFLNLFLLVSYFVNGQDSLNIECPVKGYIFYSNVNPEIGIVYSIKDRTSGRIDTLLISGMSSNVKTCICTDTVIACFIDHYTSPSVYRFVYKNGKWNFSKTFSLPPVFPLIGFLIEGKVYEKYKHTLVGVDQVDSELTVLKAEEGELVPIEKYAVHFKVDVRSNTFVVEKKILRD